MSNELYHHGILGMKWGIRRFQKSDGSLTSAGKNRYSKDYKKSKEIHSKSKKELSNKELRTYVERRSLEKDYWKSTPVGSFLTENGGKNAKTLATVAGVATGVALLNKFGTEGAVNVVAKATEVGIRGTVKGTIAAAKVGGAIAGGAAKGLIRGVKTGVR